MVSLGSTALLGIGAIILVFLVTRKSNGINIMPENTFVKLIDTPQITEIMENPQIQILKDAISGVQGFIKNTFKAPILTKGLVTGGKQLKCRGPNCLGSFQAKGTRTSFDPFTGSRVVVGFTDRASTFLKKITSGVDVNVARISAGGDLLSQAQGIVTDLKGQLNILQTKSV